MSDLESKPHDEAIRVALITLDVNPDYVARRYLEAVLEEEDFNLTAAAKRLNMHRRTIQRIMGKNRPPIRLPPLPNGVHQ